MAFLHIFEVIKEVIRSEVFHIGKDAIWKSSQETYGLKVLRSLLSQLGLSIFFCFQCKHFILLDHQWLIMYDFNSAKKAHLSKYRSNGIYLFHT